jgi:hypothetical protein
LLQFCMSMHTGGFSSVRPQLCQTNTATEWRCPLGLTPYLVRIRCDTALRLLAMLSLNATRSYPV